MNENVKWLLMLVVTVLGVVVPVIIFGITRETKGLVYEITGGGILLKGDILKTEEVKVVFGEDPLENLDFHLVKIANDGKVPIKRQDFDSPLTISYPKETRVLSAKLWKTTPQNLDVKLSTTNNIVTVEPLLLNKDENMVLQILSTGKQMNPVINARIIGLDYIKDNMPDRSEIEKRFNIYLVMSFFTAFLYGAIPFLLWHKGKVYLPKFLLILVLISALMASVNLNTKYLILHKLDRTSWPSNIMLISVALGALYSRFILTPRALTK